MGVSPFVYEDTGELVDFRVGSRTLRPSAFRDHLVAYASANNCDRQKGTVVGHDPFHGGPV